MEGIILITSKANKAKYDKARKESFRLKAYEVAGDSCAKCDEFKEDVRMLELHHIDPSIKSFELSANKITSKNIKLVINEAKKCLPLCPNCHRMYHLGYWNYSELDLSKLKDYQIELIENYASK